MEAAGVILRVEAEGDRRRQLATDKATAQISKQDSIHGHQHQYFPSAPVCGDVSSAGSENRTQGTLIGQSGSAEKMKISPSDEGSGRKSPSEPLKYLMWSNSDITLG